MNALRCLRCDRVLREFAVSIPDGKGGLVGWGPTCSKLVVVKRQETRRITRHRERPAVEYRQRVQARDPRQLDWVEMLA
jgi:hypothetical protein